MRTPPQGTFDSARFMPRGECGGWLIWIEQVYAYSHLAISVAYFAIPAILLLAAAQELAARQAGRPELAHAVTDLTAAERTQARAAYALFILTCGIGHFEGLVSFSWPNYHLFAFWHALTALISWWAVFVTFRLRAKIITGV